MKSPDGDHCPSSHVVGGGSTHFVSTVDVQIVSVISGGVHTVHGLQSVKFPVSDHCQSGHVVGGGSLHVISEVFVHGWLIIFGSLHVVLHTLHPGLFPDSDHCPSGQEPEGWLSLYVLKIIEYQINTSIISNNSITILVRFI